MSEHLQMSTSTQEVDNNVLLTKLNGLVDTLDFQAGSFLLADNGQVRQGERLEPMNIDVPGGTAHVIRHRYSEKINLLQERRERYYSIQDLGRPILLYMDADLTKEDDLVSAGDFSAVISLHRTLARHTALGLAEPDVKVGHSQDIRHFSVLVRDALRRQKVLSEGKQAS